MLSILPPQISPQNHQNYPYFHQFPPRNCFSPICTYGSLCSRCSRNLSTVPFQFNVALLINILSNLFPKTAKNAKKTHVFTYFGWFYVVFFSVFNDFQRVFYCGPVPAFHGPGKTLNSFFFLKFFFENTPLVLRNLTNRTWKNMRTSKWVDSSSPNRDENSKNIWVATT